MEALSPVASKWKAIGTALRLKRNKLDEFELKHNGDVNECLTDTIAEYVRMCYDVKKHGEPTWGKIVRAVEHQAGGNNRAHAIVIARDHKKGVPHADAQFVSFHNPMPVMQRDHPIVPLLNNQTP